MGKTCARFMRRGVSLLLAAAMVATFTPLPAFAEEAIEELDAIEVVEDEPVIEAEDIAEEEPLYAEDEPAEEPISSQAPVAIELNKEVTIEPATEYVLEVPADGYLSLVGQEPRMKNVFVSAVPFVKGDDDVIYLRGSRLITEGWCGFDMREWGQNTWVGVKKGKVYLGTNTGNTTCTITFTKDDFRDYDRTARPIQVKKGTTTTYTGHVFTGSKDGQNPIDFYTFKLDKATKVNLYVNVLRIRESNIIGYPSVDIKFVKGKVEYGTSYGEDAVVNTHKLDADKNDFELNEDGDWVGLSSIAPKNYPNISLAKGEYTIVVSSDSMNCDYQIGLMDQSFDDVSFPDVPKGHWAKQVVSKAVTYGLFSGYKDGKFGANDSITRAQVAVVLWNMQNKPNSTGGKSFSDVKIGSYYYKAVRWASGMGIVNGYKDGKFGPNDPVTREQLAVMLANYAKSFKGADPKGAAVVIKGMADAGQVSGYAKDSIGWCFSYGVLSGANGKIMPKGKATRAQAAKMFVKVYEM